MEIVGIFLIVLGIPTLVALIRQARERNEKDSLVSQTGMSLPSGGWPLPEKVTAERRFASYARISSVSHSGS